MKLSLKTLMPAQRKSAGLVGPDAVHVHPRRLDFGNGWCETLVVSGYPREVSLGWLSPLLSYPGPTDVSLHVEPIPNEEAARHLRRQLARFESTRRLQARAESLADPEIDTAAADAAALSGALARGEERLFRVGLSLTCWGRTEEALDEEIARVKSLCASMLLDVRPVTFRALQGWITALPLDIDALRLRRTFDTYALSAAFPFDSSEIQPDSGGILFGRNAATGSPVVLDRFALENHNQVVLARSGAGKSYFSKLQIRRLLYTGVHVLVVDPENEYERLAHEVGGTVVRLGAQGARLNPLDLAFPGQPEALVEQSLFCHTVIASLLDGVSAEERAVLDAAILAAYSTAGITQDPSTHERQAPLLADVVRELQQLPSGGALALRLGPFVSGSHRGLFDAPTTVRPEGHLVVFSLRDVPEELKAPATLLALDAIWRQVTRGERRPRVVVVDEAWLLLRSARQDGVRFLQRLAKSARKHWAGLTTITQDVADVIGTDLGQAVLTNAAHHVLLGQSPQAIEALAAAFDLTPRECSLLLTCGRGRGIVGVGAQHVELLIEAEDGAEHLLATSNPAELFSDNVQAQA